MPSKCVHLQQRSTSVSRHITTNENRHQEQNLDLLFWKASTIKNFHEQKFSLNHYVIIFQREDFSSFFLHVNLLYVKVYINKVYTNFMSSSAELQETKKCNNFQHKHNERVNNKF